MAKLTWGMSSVGALLGMALASAAGSAQAQTLEIRDSVARVVVIPEDRADITVQVSGNEAGLPHPAIRRSGRDVEIDGGLRAVRNLAGFRNSAIRNCTSGSANEAPTQPGEGASVEIARFGRVRLEDAPLLIVRVPRTVKVSSGHGVFGAIGRDAESVKLSTGGCGSWAIANVDGDVEVAIGGSGNVYMGTADKAKFSIGGSGRVVSGAVNALSSSIGGSGNVRVRSVNGPMQVNIGGSGSVTVLDGRSDDLNVSIAGSGGVRFDGVTGDAGVAIAGSGDVRLRTVTGSINSRSAGSGRVIIADRN